MGPSPEGPVELCVPVAEVVAEAPEVEAPDGALVPLVGAAAAAAAVALKDAAAAAALAANAIASAAAAAAAEATVSRALAASAAFDCGPAVLEVAPNPIVGYIVKLAMRPLSRSAELLLCSADGTVGVPPDALGPPREAVPAVVFPAILGSIVTLRRLLR